MGKSTISAFLQDAGFPVVDTDILARELTVAEGAALPEIVRVFGRGVLAVDGGLNRSLMADRIFRNEECRGQLEAILHPRIRSAWQEQVQGFRDDSERLIFVVIPLLFETACAAELDRVVCVACRAQEQMDRLRERGWSEAHANARIEAQWPIERKIGLADVVIWTSCQLHYSYRQLTDTFGLDQKLDHSLEQEP